MFKSNMICCFIVWLFVAFCQIIMLPRLKSSIFYLRILFNVFFFYNFYNLFFMFLNRSSIVTVSLLLTTLILSCALVLAMAEEFDIFPKQLQNISAILVQNRSFRTLFICGIVALMCFASTMSLVIY